MKKIVFSIVFFIMLIFIGNISNATTISVSPAEPKVGDDVTITVTVPNVHTSAVTANVSGVVQGTIKVAGGDLAGEAKDYSKSGTFKCTKQGTINIEITSESSAVLSGQYVDVSAKKTVTVKEASNSNSGGTTGNTGNDENTGNTGNVGNKDNSTEIKQEKSTEARLSNFGIKPNDFSGFKRDKTEYSTEVPNDVSEVEVYATAVNPKAKITGAGKVSLKEGDNKVSVTVTAEDGKTTKTYTLTIKRKTAEETTDNNEESVEVTALKDDSKFGLSTLEVRGFLLNPEFETDIYEYKLELNEDLSELDIETIATHDDTTVEIIGNEELQLGENTITILVRNKKTDETATYQIIVNKDLETTETEVVANVEKKSWLSPSTWGKEEIIKIIIISVLIILIIIAIVLKIKIAKENKNEEDFDFPGGDELDKALAEHQELSETAEFIAGFNIEDGKKYNENQNKEEKEYSENYIEDIAKSKKYDIDFQDEVYEEKTKKRKGKHF